MIAEAFFSSENLPPVLYCTKCGTPLDLYFRVKSIHGKYILCPNFPKCTHHLRPSKAAGLQLQKEGLKVYSWERVCYRCHQNTRVYTYFLNYQLQDEYANMCMGNIGLGNVYELDKLMMKYFSSIQMRKTKHEDFLSSYAANTCEHCGATQGYYYVVDDPDEPNLVFELNKYLYTTIPCPLNETLIQALSFLD